MKKIIILFLGLINFSGSTQTISDFQNIVPLSPNAASIVKFGEIPIGLFSGVPDVNIPFHTIESSELTLPINLSYHAGGNKVETIASWVGLGWALTGIPSISRSVRGIPDDKGGFFLKYNNKTIGEWYDLYSFDPQDSQIQLFKQKLFSQDADSEPDIFFYSLSGESGRFFWDQKLDEFVTTPRSNLKISFDYLSSKFTVVDDNGIVYYFDVKETQNTQSNIPGESESVITTWYASKMESPSGADKIEFHYSDELNYFNTVNVVTKYQYLYGSGVGIGELLNEQSSIMVTNIIHSKRINKISFNSGYIEFLPTSNPRLDLHGGSSLESISLFNYYDTIAVKKINLSYSYLTGSKNIQNDPYCNKWMLLNTVEIEPNDENLQSNFYRFFYKTSNIPPNRLIAAQDYWGFFNGKTGNEDLIPNFWFSYFGVPIFINGADRSVNPNTSDFGIIERIIYPTGGYSDFYFENNEVKPDSDVYSPYKDKSVIIAGDDFFAADDTLAILFEETSEVFTINNPPDPLLNGNHPYGGALVKFQVGYPGCEFNFEEANDCARFQIIGVNGTINSYDITGAGPTLPNGMPGYETSFYLPNGNYKLRVRFNQTIPQYENFIFIGMWKEKADEEIPLNKLAGGLRIKEIRSYPNGSTAVPVIKKTIYTEDLVSGISSGDVFGKPPYLFHDLLHFPVSGSPATIFLRLKSFSNIQQISHSGSHVGYSKVYVSTDSIGSSGLSIYKFSNTRDVQFVEFPFPPSLNNEHKRGLLLEEEHLKIVDGFKFPLKKRELKYSFVELLNEDVDFDAIKWGNNAKHYENGLELFNSAQILNGYRVTKESIALLEKEIITHFFDSLTVVSIINNFYDNPSHFYLTRTETLNNCENKLSTYFYYPQDYDLVENLNTLIMKNIINKPLDNRTYSENRLIWGNQFEYSDYGEPIRILRFNEDYPDEPFDESSPYSFSEKSKVEYSSNRRIQEINYEGGITFSFIWGYNHTLPIAKLENISQNKIPASLKTKIQQLEGFTGDLTANDRDSIINLNNEIRDNDQSMVMITTYTHKPLVGVTSITDPRGQTIFYEYDSFGRLKAIRDQDGKILEENEYHYAQPQ